MLDVDHIEDRVLQDRISVHRASWPNATFTEQHWHAVAASSAYRRARCLVAYDRDGNGVATTTVWSAGHGRPRPRCAPRAGTSAASRRTSRPASKGSRTLPTSATPADPCAVRYWSALAVLSAAQRTSRPIPVPFVIPLLAKWANARFDVTSIQPWRELSSISATLSAAQPVNVRVEGIEWWNCAR